jgi:hypothetical protein
MSESFSHSKTLPRSFGFNFRGGFLQGTLQQTGNNTDIFFFYAGREYESGASLTTSLNITNEESQELNDKINSLMRN